MGRDKARVRSVAAEAVLPGAGDTLSVEGAFRRVRILAAALLAIRMLATHDDRSLLSWPWVVAITFLFCSINVISIIGERGTERERAALGVVQLVADTVLVLTVLWARQGDSQSADWAILVLPVLEGAIRFQLVGALASWLAVAAGYIGWNAVND